MICKQLKVQEEDANTLKEVNIAIAETSYVKDTTRNLTVDVEIEELTNYLDEILGGSY